jgi:septal ring factor EnvC (AmiA/AmiB activator)
LGGVFLLIFSGMVLYIRYQNNQLQDARNRLAQTQMVTQIQQQTIADLERQAARAAEALRKAQQNVREIERSTMVVRQDLRTTVEEIGRLLATNPKEAARLANDVSRKIHGELRAAGQ